MTKEPVTRATPSRPIACSEKTDGLAGGGELVGRGADLGVFSLLERGFDRFVLRRREGGELADAAHSGGVEIGADELQGELGGRAEGGPCGVGAGNDFHELFLSAFLIGLPWTALTRPPGAGGGWSTTAVGVAGFAAGAATGSGSPLESIQMQASRASNPAPISARRGFEESRMRGEISGFWREGE